MTGTITTTITINGLPASCGWVCPKCGRVYGPAVKECAACNTQVTPTPPAPVTTIAAPMVGPKEVK